MFWLWHHLVFFLFSLERNPFSAQLYALFAGIRLGALRQWASFLFFCFVIYLLLHLIYNKKNERLTSAYKYATPNPELVCSRDDQVPVKKWQLAVQRVSQKCLHQYVKQKQKRIKFSTVAITDDPLWRKLSSRIKTKL